MNALSRISITYLAPLSVICELLMLYSFLRLKQLKRHPETLVFWVCCAQLILDLHWFTGIPSIRNSLKDYQCQFLGSLCIYFYILSWNYNLLLSFEILIKIRYPHQTNYKSRQIWYHVISNLISLAAFLVLMTGDNNGGSLSGTCYVQSKSQYEIISALPLFFQFPLCICFTAYTIWISYSTFYAQYLNSHMLVVVVFGISWIPGSVMHVLDAFHVDIPVWYATVRCT